MKQKMWAVVIEDDKRVDAVWYDKDEALWDAGISNKGKSGQRYTVKPCTVEIDDDE